MVWGMYLPRGGGPYGPYGYDEGPVDHSGDGWRHRLIKYYVDEMPEAQKAYYRDPWKYVSRVVQKFEYEIGRKLPGLEGIVVTPIEDHEPLRFFQTKKGYKELSSIISLNNRIWAVDEAVRRTVEQCEPGLHQFYPVEIRMPRSRVYSVPYYVLIVGKWLESFSPEESDPEAFRRNGLKSVFIHGYKKDINGLALRRSVFEGSHLWRERAFGEWLICLSDPLAAKLAAAGLMLPKHFRMRVANGAQS